MGCGSCGEFFKKEETSVRCDDCWLWFHLNCTDLTSAPDDDEIWHCPKCSNKKNAAESQNNLLASIMQQFLNSRNETAVYIKRQGLQTLQIFDGDITKYVAFKKIFKKTAEEGEFSNVEQSARLLGHLTQTIRDKVAVKLVNPENIKDAWAYLDLHYGDTNLIHDALVRKLMGAQLRDNNRKNFLDFATDFSNFVDNLIAMDAEERCLDSRLIRDLVARFPLPQQENWVKFARNKNANDCRIFNQFLQERAEILIQLPGMSRDAGPSNAQARGRVHVQSEPQEQRVKCVLCDQEGHKIFRCQQFLGMTVNDRWAKVRELRLCFGCLGRSNHRLNQCRATRNCGVDGCDKKHNRLLHSRPNANAEIPLENQNRASENRNIATGPNLNIRSFQPTHFMIIPVSIRSNDKIVDTYAFLDYGSAFTLIDSTLARDLELNGTPEPLAMICAKGMVAQENESIITSFKISGQHKGKCFEIRNARTVENLRLPKATQDASSLQVKFPHLKGIPLPSFKDVTPRLLIGVDNSHLISYTNVSELPGTSTIAAKTKLGWCIFGKSDSTEKSAGLTLIMHEQPNIEEEEDLHEVVKRFFTTENFGIKPLVDEVKSAEQRRVDEIVATTLEKIEENGPRFQIGLLWKHDDVHLPDSYQLAYKRLLYVEEKMKKDDELREWYVSQIRDYESKGYVQKLNRSEIPLRGPKIWYIPHFPIINPNKIPVKRRLIFDAAAKVGKVSLNTFLLAGPNNYPSLSGIVFRSREGPICVAGDIKEMFPQVKIKPEDCNAQRFLWRDGDSSRDPDIWVSNRMIFGARCSPFLAQAVKNSNAETFRTTNPAAVDAIIKQHYVDDFLDSFTSEENAICISTDVINIHRQAGFNLRNFVSNSQGVLKSLPKPEETVKEICLNFDGDNLTEKILGMFWNVKTDCYEFRLNLNKIHNDILIKRRPPTKRELLRIVMSVFDPIGLLSHVLIRPKVIIQETWRSGVGWDESLTPILQEKWEKWFEKFREIENLKIPRVYSKNIANARRIEMHTFVDASEYAFSAVVYFRIEFEDGVDIALVTSKSKVAPNKVLSIPRLELQAALLGSRLANTVKLEHRLAVDACYYWSDSATVLAWIVNTDPQRLKPFVSVRIGEILELTTAAQWRKVPTKLNVADDATKWSEATTYCFSRWFTGPDFLTNSPETWPTTSILDLPPLEEVRSPVYLLTESDVSFAAVPDDKFSRFSTLSRVMGYVWKFVRCSKDKTPINLKKEFLTLVKGGKARLPVLTAIDIQAAEETLIRKTQFDEFRVEYLALLNGDTISPKSKIYCFSPVMGSDRIIRINSRTKAAPGISTKALSPAILPNKHVITDLLVRRQHERFAHQFQESVIAALRQKYWIVHIRSAVRRAKAHCQFCKNKSAVPIPTLMGNLPICRLDWKQKPFTHVGLDFFGPINATIFRRTVKCYGMIFVCMVTRGIHLELARSLTTDSCILNLRNFLNRHGPTFHIYSDNGSNIRGSYNELTREFEALTGSLASANEENYIQWHWNPPTGSHFGGAYERLIQSVRKALEIILKDQSPQEETLRSALIECENIVNSRPLTHVPIDSEDADPLTPNHFLKMNANCLPAPGEFDDRDLNLRKQWRVAQQLANNFWNRWRLEYLPDLARRTKWYDVAPEFKIGDIVLIVDNQSARNYWKKGKIVELFYGKDKIARVAQVLSNNKFYKRPISKLAKLDVK
jgi:hypothetical protein